MMTSFQILLVIIGIVVGIIYMTMSIAFCCGIGVYQRSRMPDEPLWKWLGTKIVFTVFGGLLFVALLLSALNDGDE